MLLSSCIEWKKRAWCVGAGGGQERRGHCQGVRSRGRLAQMAEHLLVFRAAAVAVLHPHFVLILILGGMLGELVIVTLIVTFFRLVSCGINTSGGRTPVLSEGHLLVQPTEFS